MGSAQDTGGRRRPSPTSTWQGRRARRWPPRTRAWRRAQQPSADTGHLDGRGGRYRHQPQCHRLRRPGVPEPQGLLRRGTEAQTLAADPGAQDEMLPGLVGSSEAGRQVPSAHTRNQAQRHPSDDQHPHTEIQRARNRGPEHRRNDGWANPQGPGRRRHGTNSTSARIQGTMAAGAIHTGPPAVPQQQAVQFMPVS